MSAEPKVWDGWLRMKGGVEVAGRWIDKNDYDRLAAKNQTLRGILDRLVCCDTSTEIGQIITGKAAVEAARAYVAERGSSP